MSDEIPAGDEGAMPDDVVLAVVLHDNRQIAVYSKQATTAADLAAALRVIADSFEAGDVNRLA